jgi:hypothetical protein
MSNSSTAKPVVASILSQSAAVTRFSFKAGWQLTNGMRRAADVGKQELASAPQDTMSLSQEPPLVDKAVCGLQAEDVARQVEWARRCIAGNGISDKEVGRNNRIG